MTVEISELKDEGRVCGNCGERMKRTEPPFKRIWSCEGDYYICSCGISIYELVRAETQ